MNWGSIIKGLLTAVGVVVLCALGTSSVLHAQPFGAASLFAADPNAGWVPDRIDRGDDFLPPPSGPGPVTFDKRYPFVQSGVANQPTDRVADLTNPILKPWVIERLKASNDRVLAGKIPFVARERCWPAGVPGFAVYSRFVPLRFLQRPGVIVMINEQYTQIRHVYMDVPHSQNLGSSWYGESVGHWEGDELVVDTIGLNDRTLVDNYGTPHTDRLHVVERFKLIEGGVTLQATITVEDPGAFNMPWSAIQRWRQTTDGSIVERGPIVERPCNESLLSYFGYDVAPIPQDDTPDF